VKKIPKLIINIEKGFSLMLNQHRCQGCEICVSVCPTGILEMSDQLNMRVAFLPKVKEGKEKYCTACKRCEYTCPIWAIYIVPEIENEITVKKEEAKI